MVDPGPLGDGACATASSWRPQPRPSWIDAGVQQRVGVLDAGAGQALAVVGGAHRVAGPARRSRRRRAAPASSSSPPGRGRGGGQDLFGVGLPAQRQVGVGEADHGVRVPERGGGRPRPAAALRPPGRAGRAAGPRRPSELWRRSSSVVARRPAAIRPAPRRCPRRPSRSGRGRRPCGPPVERSGPAPRHAAGRPWRRRDWPALPGLLGQGRAAPRGVRGRQRRGREGRRGVPGARVERHVVLQRLGGQPLLDAAALFGGAVAGVEPGGRSRGPAR